MKTVFAKQLTAGDYGALMIHCQTFEEIAEHVEALRAEGWSKSGNRGEVQNPRAKQLEAARRALLTADEALGITAKSRVRLPDEAPDATGKKPDGSQAGGPENFRVVHGAGA